MKTAAQWRKWRKRAGLKWLRKHTDWNRDYRHSHPERARAWQFVKQALAVGWLDKPRRCEDCRRRVRLQAHHPDYAIPLCVVWLCRRCHAEVHR